ncbi:hypothetical protein AVEN_170964-1, partial [Araneus ventricosus]
MLRQGGVMFLWSYIVEDPLVRSASCKGTNGSRSSGVATEGKEGMEAPVLGGTIESKYYCASVAYLHKKA